MDDLIRLFYWTVWTGLVFVSKIVGFFGVVSNSLTDVQMPTHTIKYLPQLSEAMPAFIIAGGCALISAIVSKVVGALWNKLFSTPVKD